MIGIVLAVVAFFAEALSESDFELGVWEPEFVDIYGEQLIWIIIGVAAICSIAIILYLLKKGKESNTKEDLSDIV